MKKAELIKHLSEQTGLTQKAVTEVFSALDLALVNNAAAGEDTVLGLLTVSTVEKAARMGRNPATGEPKEIAARTAIKVKVSKTLKDAGKREAK